MEKKTDPFPVNIQTSSSLNKEYHNITVTVFGYQILLYIHFYSFYFTGPSTGF